MSAFGRPRLVLRFAAVAHPLHELGDEHHHLRPSAVPGEAPGVEKLADLVVREARDRRGHVEADRHSVTVNQCSRDGVHEALPVASPNMRRPLHDGWVARFERALGHRAGTSCVWDVGSGLGSIPLAQR